MKDNSHLSIPDLYHFSNISLIQPNAIYPINSGISVEGVMFDPFKKDKAMKDDGATAKQKQRKARQEERRQRAQARGQKPIK
jgi:hypothetical protein